ncbi:MAG: hypothetical protein JXR11_07700 [Balneola sp.]
MSLKKTEHKSERQQTEDLFKQLIDAYKKADDFKMSQAIEALAEEKKDRKKAGSYLYQAIDLRPWDGKKYDPKSWREDVTKSINKLYDVERLTRALDTEDSSEGKKMKAEFEVIFEEPLDVIRPVLDAKIEIRKYSELVAGLLESVMEAVQEYIQFKGKRVEKVVTIIDRMDKKIENLASELDQEELKYRGYIGFLRNVYGIRNILNSVNN